MSDKKQDIRITRTHIALENVMLELLQEKSFSKITVNDICLKALVSRSTFYLHFEDKYQLLEYCLWAERERLEPNCTSDKEQFIRELLENVKAKKEVYQNFISTNNDYELVEILRKMFYTFFYEFFEKLEQQGSKLAGSIQLMAVYYANGFVGMILWWINGDFKHPIEDLVQTQSSMIDNILPAQ